MLAAILIPGARRETSPNEATSMTATAVTYIETEFADGLYKFQLGMPQILELEQKTGIGIGALFARVIKGRYDADGDLIILPTQGEYHVTDLVETIRQGLIGGNHAVVDGVEVKVTPVVAQRLITTYVIPRPVTEAWGLAVAILGALIVGHQPEQPVTVHG